MPKLLAAVRGGSARVSSIAGHVHQLNQIATLVSYLVWTIGHPPIMETAKDITERQRVEEALYLNELHAHALLQLHEMAEQPMQMVIDFALEKAIELTRSKIGYLAFVNPDETLLTMHSWPKEQRASEPRPQMYPVSESGRWAEAIRQRRPVIADQDAPANRSEKSASHGVELMRHMDVPVFEGERIVAVAGMGNKETPYDENDVRQLMLLLLGMWRLMQRKEGEDRLRGHSGSSAPQRGLPDRGPEADPHGQLGRRWRLNRA